MASQWLFSLPALSTTPSVCLLEKEFYDRARGVEFLFRLGSSLALSAPILIQTEHHLTCTIVLLLHYARLQPGSIASTCGILWKIFTVRYVDLDCMGQLFIPKQDVAASCVFLATKTEECGRKLRDVARVYQAKVKNIDVNAVPGDSKVFDSKCFSLEAYHDTGSRCMPVSDPFNGRGAAGSPLLRFRCGKPSCRAFGPV